MALALRNALLVTNPPAFLQVTGSFTAAPTELDSGGLILSFGVQALLPILPDPYAANFVPALPAPNAPPATASSLVLATVTWSATAATQLSFSDASIAPQSLQVTQLTAHAPPQDQRQELARLSDPFPVPELDVAHPSKIVRVTTVIDGLPAEAAGFREGDEIVSTNGTSIASQESFNRQLDSGGDINVVVMRAGKQLQLHMKPRF